MLDGPGPGWPEEPDAVALPRARTGLSSLDAEARSVGCPRSRPVRRLVMTTRSMAMRIQIDAR